MKKKALKERGRETDQEKKETLLMLWTIQRLSEEHKSLENVIYHQAESLSREAYNELVALHADIIEKKEAFVKRYEEIRQA